MVLLSYFDIFQSMYNYDYFNYVYWKSGKSMRIKSPKLSVILSSPQMVDLDSTILAKIFNSFLWYGIITTLVISILAILFGEDPLPRITLSICYILVFLISLTILHRKQLILSAKILVYAMGALLTLAILLFDGLHGISFSGYIIIILVASLILGYAWDYYLCMK
jgi:hypothetical protein